MIPILIFINIKININKFNIDILKINYYTLLLIIMFSRFNNFLHIQIIVGWKKDLIHNKAI